MALETATYISDLVPANPLAGDPLNQGDDHIRLLKSVLQATLPGTGSLAGALVPVGGIILWSGSVVSIPANWHLCDGTTGTPDLRDKFVVGAGSTYAVAATGGSLTTSSDGSHSHTGATGGHALTYTEIPNDTGTGAVIGPLQKGTSDIAAAAHTHPISADGAHTHTATPPYLALAYIQRIS
jgi:hypothetical protein